MERYGFDKPRFSKENVLTRFIFLGFFIFALISLPSVSATIGVVDANQVAYFNMEQGSGVNLTNHWTNNNCTLSAGIEYNSTVPVFNTSGNGSSFSISYQGVDESCSSTSTAFSLQNKNWTMSVWIRAQAASGTVYISNHGQDGSNDPDYGIGQYNIDTDQVLCWSTNITPNGGRVLFNAPTAMPGGWANLICTWNGTDLAMYINGTVASINSTPAAPGNPGSHSNNLWIGVNRVAGGGVFNGQIDHYMLWNESVNSTQASNLYNYGNVTAPAAADTTAPTFSVNKTNNTAPKINQDVNFSIDLADETALSHYIFSWDNGTGTFTNDSATSVSGTNTSVNKTKTIQRVSGTTMQWRWYANDTTNNWDSTTIESFVVADTTGTFTSNVTNNTAPKINENVNFSIVLTDADTLSHRIFSYDNGTGTFVNDSAVTISGTTFNVNVTKIIERANGTTIQWRWFFNDTANNYYVSTTESFIVTDTPPTVALNEPADAEHLKVNGSSGNPIPFNFTVSDADNATVATYNCSVMYNASGSTPNAILGNGTNTSVKVGNKTTLNVNGTNQTAQATALANGRYAWLVTCTSNGTYYNSSTRTVVIDSDLPDITWTFPALGSTTKLNSTTLNLNIECSDTNLERANITIKNNASGAIIYSNLSTNLTSSPYRQNASLNLGTNASGNYTVEMSCADDVSGSPKISDKLSDTKETDDISKAGVDTFKFTDINNPAQNLKITASFQKSTKDNEIKPDDLVLTSSFVNGGTKLKFGLSFTVPSNGAVLVLDLFSDSPITDRSFASGKTAHFIWGRYYTEFTDALTKTTVDGIPSDIIVTTNTISNTHIQVIIEGKVSWEKNQIVVVDPVTGGLNVNTETTNFIFDTVAPTFDNNITNKTNPRINEHVNFSINITDDIELSHWIFSYDNGTGIFVNDSAVAILSGTNVNVNKTKTIDRNATTVIQWRWYANDSAGNWNSSTIEQLTVQDTAINFTNNVTNNTAPKINENVNFSIDILDADGLSHWIFSYDNGTGTFVNDSAVAILGVNIANASVNKTKTIQRVRNTIITWKWFANDSKGKMNESGNFSFIVANTAPVTPNILAPGNNSNQSSTPVNLQYNTTDIDNDSITYFVFINGTLNGSTTGNWSFNATDSTYTWYVIAGDTFTNSSNSSINQFILDSTGPTMTLNAPSNASSHSTDTITFTYNVTDVHEIKNCTLWIEQGDGFLQRRADTAIEKQQNNSWTVAGLENEKHYWMVQCYDNFNSTSNSSIFNFTVSIGSGASQGGGASPGANDGSSFLSQILGRGETRVLTTEELSMHVQASLLEKLLPDFSKDEIDGICGISEDPIFVGKSDCSFSLRDFSRQQIYRYSWFSRYLLVGIISMAVLPGLFVRKKL